MTADSRYDIFCTVLLDDQARNVTDVTSFRLELQPKDGILVLQDCHLLEGGIGAAFRDGEVAVAYGYVILAGNGRYRSVLTVLQVVGLDFTC